MKAFGAETVYGYLTEHGVKPSVQRMAVMGYLLEHTTHPTAEEIYAGLCKSLPTLSKATVYNTLNLLVENGAARMLTIDRTNVHYDGKMEEHAHLMCRKCKRIYDLKFEANRPDLPRNTTEGHSLEEIAICYNGVCANCQEKTKDLGNTIHNN